MPPELSRLVAVTGAGGFIGSNLMLRLRECGIDARPITRDTTQEEARGTLAQANVIFHLAGANRPADTADFTRLNRDYAADIVGAAGSGGKCPLVVVSSTAKVRDDSPYGRSKREGEEIFLAAAEAGAVRTAIYRLPNVFGKWARPNYNSVVATFCHNLARGLPIRIDDPAAPLELLHIDDLIGQWMAFLDEPARNRGIVRPEGVFRTTVGEVAQLVGEFARSRRAGSVPAVGTGLARRLYASFMAALPEEEFSYPLAVHSDVRGRFVEMLKMPASGQVSCFTAYPGVTRGGHYHHAKVEKFLVVHGRARFRFRHVLTGATQQVQTSADEPRIVESVPGWAHDVTNAGSDMLVVLVWANECFDPARPDTEPMPL